MASPNLSELVTTTLRNRTRTLANNVLENNVLLSVLNGSGKVKTFSGGQNITHELSYAENSTYKRYSGYEQLDVSPSDVFTAAEYAIKQSAVAISISGLEMLQNSGREQMIDLLESRIDNAQDTMMNNISADIYSDGTADSSKQIGGLQHIISTTPTTGTVGSINRATYSFWRNKATNTGGLTSSNARAKMTAMYNQLIRNADKPDLIVADGNYYNAYESELQGIQRIMDTGSDADGGFESLRFKSVRVYLDGGYGGSAPTNRMYFINTKFLKFRPHSKRNMVPLNPDRFAVNQDALVKLIAFAGNLTCGNSGLQGVLFE